MHDISGPFLSWRVAYLRFQAVQDLPILCLQVTAPRPSLRHPHLRPFPAQLLSPPWPSWFSQTQAGFRLSHKLPAPILPHCYPLLHSVWGYSAIQAQLSRREGLFAALLLAQHLHQPCRCCFSRDWVLQSRELSSDLYAGLSRISFLVSEGG